MQDLVNSHTTNSDLFPIFLRLPPDNIVILQNILESYEDLGILRTLDSQAGEVVILAVRDTVNLVRELIQSLSEYSIREIPQPVDLSGDWLLSEDLPTLKRAQAFQQEVD